MTPTIIDQNGRLTVAAAEAQAALAAGDTHRAREKYAEAGAILEREASRMEGQEGAHLALFLAATQYYKGGHYEKAHALARKVRAKSLPAGVAPLLPGFLRDAQDRAARDYESRVRERLQALWAAKDYAGIIDILQQHPYAVEPASMAFIRGACCEGLGQYRAAVLFFADASRWAPHDPAPLAALVPVPLNLPSQGRLREAWEYVQVQLELFPNAVSYAVASLLCSRRAQEAAGDTRTNLFQEQARYFQRAREEYARLPPPYQSDPEIKALMGLGYAGAALALRHSGDEKAAREMCEAAIAFDPYSPMGWAVLGIMTSDGPEAAGAFKRAVDLGDPNYLPYAYLAYDAQKRGDFREALDWARQALARAESEDHDVKSLLYQWSAISLANLGGPRDEVEALFRKAIEVAPENELARKNYRHFQESEVPELPPLAPRLFQRPGPGGDEILRNQEVSLFQLERNADQVEKRLAAAGA